MRRAIMTVVVMSSVLATVLIGSFPITARSQDETVQRANRAEFMRLKLDYAKNVLEGLSMDKLDMVSKNARDLRIMSAAAQWEVPKVPRPEYNEYTAEFQRIALDIANQADEGNLDAATLAYVQLTLNCVNCHKYVRKIDR